jgi:N4-gp56 family major capsid protein
MAYTSYALGDSETVKLWEKMLSVAERATLDIAPLMGTSENAIIHVKEETQKGAGDRVTFGLRTRLTQKGISSSGTVAGNAESLSTYTDNIVIDELWCNVGTKSEFTIDAQRVPFNLRRECKNAAADWWRDRKVETFFNHVCGYTPKNTDGDTSGTQYTGNNTVTAPASGTGLTRHIWAGTATTDQGLANSDTFVLSLIDRAVEAARTGNRMVQMVMVGGQQKYVLYISERQARQLRTATTEGGWQDITKFTYSGVDVSKNPLYTGALGEYNRCILRVSQDVTHGVHSGTGAEESDVHRAVLLGRQAAVTAFGRKGYGPSKYRWNEELTDHKRKLEVSAHQIWGLKKGVFNSVDHGTVVISTHDGS